MKILIVVDMQNDFIDGSLSAEGALNIIPYVKEKINKFPGEVIFTMDTHGDDYLETLEGKKLPIIHCIKNTEGWKLREGVYKKKAKIFEKNRFASLDLAEYLSSLNQKEKIESIELIGICTDICVISNAILIKSFLPEVEIIVDSNACAGVTLQSHEQALATMKMCQIKVI